MTHSRAQAMVRIGDLLQSEASRLAEWVRNQHGDNLPHEIIVTLTNVEQAVISWTELRRGGGK